MTDEQLNAANWETLKKAKALKGRMASLENEAKETAKSLHQLANALSSHLRFEFRFSEHELQVYNAHQHMALLDTIPLQRCSIQAIKELVEDYVATNREFEEKRLTLRANGVDIDTDFSI